MTIYNNNAYQECFKCKHFYVEMKTDGEFFWNSLKKDLVFNHVVFSIELFII
jgi:hypothetical protein